MSMRLGEQGQQRVDSSNSAASTSSSAALSYAESYTKIVQQLRQTLIEQADDTRNQRSLVRSIFNRMDDNASGVLTVQEMKDFLISPELRIFQPDDPFCEKFSELILEQIDLNRDGNVSLEELEDFLFPSSPHGSPTKGSTSTTNNKDMEGHFETGIVLDFTRRALIQHLSATAATGSDEAILTDFSALAKVSVKKGGKQIESRIAKKAFLHVFIPQFKRTLHEDEVDALMKTIDINGDGFITAKEFKGWLFPTSQNEEKVQLSLLLKSVIDDNFGGDERALFDEFKSYGADCIYKNDFVTNLKALDNTISRQLAQDLSNALAGNDKGITYGRFQDFLGLARSAMRFEEGIPRTSSMDSQPPPPLSLSPRLEHNLVSAQNTQQHANMTAGQLSEQFQDLELQSEDDDNEDEEEAVAVVEDPGTLTFSEQAGSTMHTMDSLDLPNLPLAAGRIPFSGGSVTGEQAGLEHTGDSQASSHDGDHRALTRHNSGISMRSTSTASPEKLHRSPSRRDDFTGEGASPHMMKQRSLPNTMMRSILKQAQERMQDTAVSEEGSPLARTKSAIPAMEVNPSAANGVTAQELQYVRELLQQGRHLPTTTTGSISPFKKHPPVKEVSLEYGVDRHREGRSNQLHIDQLLRRQQPEDFDTSHFAFSMDTSTGLDTSAKVMKHGAVGLTSDQLIEFGYYKHAGKWRGFPLDSWSCCNTSAYICPNAKSYTAATPKDATGISSMTTSSFISTTRLSPKKLRASTEITTRFSQEFDTSSSAASPMPPPPPPPMVQPPTHQMMKIHVPSPPTQSLGNKVRVTVKPRSAQDVENVSQTAAASSNAQAAPTSDSTTPSLQVQSKAMQLTPKQPAASRSVHMLAMQRGRAQSQNVVSKQAAAQVMVHRASSAIKVSHAFQKGTVAKKTAKPTPSPPLSSAADTDALSKAYLAQVKDILHVSDPSQLQAESERKYAHYEKVLLDLRNELNASRQATVDTRSLMNHVMKEQQEGMSRLRAAVSHRMKTFQKVIKQYPSAHSRRNQDLDNTARNMSNARKRSSSAPPRSAQTEVEDRAASDNIAEYSNESKAAERNTGTEPTDNNDGLEAMFPSRNTSQHNKSTRSVSPNHRIRSNRATSRSPGATVQQRKSFVGTRYDESYHPPVRNIKHKANEGIPWVPPSSHANHKFNRANAMDPQYRHHLHDTHVNDAYHQIPVVAAEVSKTAKVNSSAQKKYNHHSNRNYLGATNEEDDFFNTLDDANIAPLPSSSSNRITKSPERYQFEHLDVDKLTNMMQPSPSEDAWDQ